MTARWSYLVLGNDPVIAILLLSHIHIFAVRFREVIESQGVFKFLSEEFSQCRA
jgi:hypothetical protein